jgi:hypothetical protein
MSNKRYFLGATLVAVVLFVTLFSPLMAQVRQPFEWIIARKLTVQTTSTLTGDVTAGDDLVVTDNVNAASLNTGGAVTVGTLVNLTAGATAVLGANGTLTPVSSYQPISATGAVGTSSIATSTVSTLLYIVNVGAQTITFTDTGTLLLTGNIALGAADSLTLVSDGTNWVQLATSNN